MMQKGSAGVNPYFYGGPIKDPQDFYGRGDQLAIAFERLNKAGSTSVIGQRASGKTSFLHYLTNEVAQRSYSIDPDAFVFLYIDPQVGVRDTRSFYRELLGRLAEKLPALPDPSGAHVDEQQVQTALKALAPKRLVLLLDEFEKIANSGGFPTDFFRFLRGLANLYEVCFITASTEALEDCCPPEVIASPFPNIFRKLHLGSLTEAEFVDFLTQTSARADMPMLAHKDRIYDLAGRFPFYVQMACSFYFDVWRERQEIRDEDHFSVRQRFADEAGPHFKAMWKGHLTQREKVTLGALARGQEPIDNQTMRGLENKGYLVDRHIFSSALTDFILRPEGQEKLRDERPMLPQGPLAHGVWVDEKSGEVWVDGKVIPPVTKLEYALLLCLYHNANGICDKYDIVEAVWSGSYIDRVDDSRIAKLISRLRRSLAQGTGRCAYIVTVHGRGYKLVSELGPSEMKAS